MEKHCQDEWFDADCRLSDSNSTRFYASSIYLYALKGILPPMSSLACKET